MNWRGRFYWDFIHLRRRSVHEIEGKYKYNDTAAICHKDTYKHNEGNHLKVETWPVVGSVGRREWSGARIQSILETGVTQWLWTRRATCRRRRSRWSSAPWWWTWWRARGRPETHGQPGECEKRQTLPHGNNCPAGSTLLPRGLVGTGGVNWGEHGNDTMNVRMFYHQPKQFVYPTW